MGQDRDGQWPQCLIRQKDADAASMERRAVGAAAMLRDIPMVNLGSDGLATMREQLAGGRTLPVGTVEFVRQALALAGIAEPAEASYPMELAWAFRRRIQETRKRDVPRGWFVKPTQTKMFTGFVLPDGEAPVALNEHDHEQWLVFQALDVDAPVLASEPVQWLCEWRYYVSGGQIAGRARYDPEGLDDAAKPDCATIDRAVDCLRDAFGSDVTRALDVGVMADGTTALVEVNDAWGGLGLYVGSLSNLAYLEMVWMRWKQLVASGGRIAFGGGKQLGS